MHPEPGPFNTTNAAIPAPASNRLTLVNGRAFAVTGPDGTITEPTDGILFEDLRVLSRLELEVGDGARPIRRQQLGVSTPTPFQAAIVSRPDPSHAEHEPTEYYVHRQWVGRGVRHDVEIHNTGARPIRRTVTVRIDNDFAHLFDVKDGRQVAGSSELSWSGTGGRLVDPVDAGRAVGIEARPEPVVDRARKQLCWDLTCPARSRTDVAFSFEPRWDGEPAGLSFPLDTPPASARPARVLAEWQRLAPSVVTADVRLAVAVESSLADLASLRIFDPDHPDRTVVAAGAPWFMTLFGRDSLLTAWMVLPFVPELALGVLNALAELQGSEERPETEEQPGKILHELRRHGGDAAFARRGRYYGTVDATPLFVMVAAEARRWGHLDDETLGGLWPNVAAAVGWVRRRIAADPWGFLGYRRSTSVGLVNQGWKDSWDGVTFADGRLPTGAIALSEVQGYAYAALIGAAELARHVADPGLDPDDLIHEAETLRQRFEAHFWDEASSSYVLGLAGDGAPIDAVTTNPGHAVWCGLTDPDRTHRYLDRILDGDLFSGWGLRTLSPSCAAYNPLSYHNGSVWPHDTAIVAAGASRIGRMDAVTALADAALDAAAYFAGRPPELFAGIARALVDVPVSYPNSCSPQAWSSASTLLHVRSMLRLAPPASAADRPTIVTNREVALTALTGVRVGEHRLRIDHLEQRVTFEPRSGD